MKGKLEKAYIVLGVDKNGNYVSPVEHSFSIRFSNVRAMLFRDNIKNAMSYLEGYRRDYPGSNFKVYRVGSKKCPVKINWAKYHSFGNKIGKFEYRNLEFSLR